MECEVKTELNCRFSIQQLLQALTGNPGKLYGYPDLAYYFEFKSEQQPFLNLFLTVKLWTMSKLIPVKLLFNRRNYKEEPAKFEWPRAINQSINQSLFNVV